MGQVFVAKAGTFLLQRGGTAMAMERWANFSDEVHRRAEQR